MSFTLIEMSKSAVEMYDLGVEWYFDEMNRIGFYIGIR